MATTASRHRPGPAGRLTREAGHERVGGRSRARAGDRADAARRPPSPRSGRGERRRIAHVVRDDQRREPQIGEEVSSSARTTVRGVRVERRQRLVEQQHLGPRARARASATRWRRPPEIAGRRPRRGGRCRRGRADRRPEPGRRRRRSGGPKCAGRARTPGTPGRPTAARERGRPGTSVDHARPRPRSARGRDGAARDRREHVSCGPEGRRARPSPGRRRARPSARTSEGRGRCRARAAPREDELVREQDGRVSTTTGCRSRPLVRSRSRGPRRVPSVSVCFSPARSRRR